MKHTTRLLVSSCAALTRTASGANAYPFVRMVSGPSGGSWYPLGAKIMQVLEENIDGIATSNTSGGGISNVLSVNGGDIDIVLDFDPAPDGVS